MLSGKRNDWFRPISEMKGGQPTPASAAPSQPASAAPSQPAPASAAPSQPASAAPSKPTPVPAPSQALDGGNMDFLSIVINTLNTNPYFIGLVMLLLNLGGRFLSMELTEKQEQFLQQRWLRPIIFFTVIFVATRNLAVAFWMTLGLFLILWILANEKSPFCIIPSWRVGDSSKDAQKRYDSNMNVIESIRSV
jgi:hypothetical protein